MAELKIRYQVRGFPTIFLFRLSNKKNKIPIEYQGDRSSKSLLHFVEERIPSFIAQVKGSGIDAFLRNEPELPHVLLATNRSSPSLLLKALSATYAGSILFGIIHKDDIDTQRMKLYGIQKYPVLLGFPPNSNATSVPNTFHLERVQRKALHEFLQRLVGREEMQSSAASSNDKQNASNMFLVDRWEEIEQHCVAHKDKVCIIFIFCSEDDLAFLSSTNWTSR